MCGRRKRVASFITEFVYWEGAGGGRIGHRKRKGGDKVILKLPCFGGLPTRVVGCTAVSVCSIVFILIGICLCVCLYVPLYHM